MRDGRPCPWPACRGARRRRPTTCRGPAGGAAPAGRGAVLGPDGHRRPSARSRAAASSGSLLPERRERSVCGRDRRARPAGLAVLGRDEPADVHQLGVRASAPRSACRARLRRPAPRGPGRRGRAVANRGREDEDSPCGDARQVGRDRRSGERFGGAHSSISGHMPRCQASSAARRESGLSEMRIGMSRRSTRRPPSPPPTSIEKWWAALAAAGRRRGSRGRPAPPGPGGRSTTCTAPGWSSISDERGGALEPQTARAAALPDAGRHDQAAQRHAGCRRRDWPCSRRRSSSSSIAPSGPSRRA